MVERPPAMVGDVNAVNAACDADLRIFGRADAFEDQRHVYVGSYAVDVIPIERRLEGFGSVSDADGRTMALGKIAFTAAVGGAIDREAYGAIAELQRPLYRAIHPFLVAAHIELEELGIVGGTADFFKTGGANRTQHMDDAGTRGGARRGHAAFGDDVLHRTDRREDDGELELLAQQGRARVDVFDIAQHARAESEAIERQTILVQGRLGFRAPHEVI